MIRRLTGQLPTWLQPEHPVLRYTLKEKRESSARARYGRAFLTLVAIALFGLVGYVAGSNFFQDNPFDQTTSQMLNNFLFWPTFGLQLVMQIAVMLMTVNTVGEAKRRQTWDSLRTTSSGAALALRTRWGAVLFYRTRWMILLLIAIRFVLIGGILLDLTAFRGEYLNYLISSIDPELPLAGGVVLLALMMTASLLLPITGLGFDAALGLLISTFVQHRTYVALVQITIIALRALVVGLLVIAITQFRTDGLEYSDMVIWLILAGFAVLGDWGLSFLYLGFYGQVVWAEVPFGVFIGLGVLVFVMIQAAITDGLLALAIRRAERSG